MTPAPGTSLLEGPAPPALSWVIYALLTVLAWGVYGVFIHKGQVLMEDPVNGRYKAFLLVGTAYFIMAVLAPLMVLFWNGASWSFTGGGVFWSLLAGIMGAMGAFFVLLAFGARGSPAVVMSIVFAGAPIINAALALTMRPPVGGLGSIRWPFYLGILLAALGGCLVTFYRPGPGPAPVQASTAGLVHSVDGRLTSQEIE